MIDDQIVWVGGAAQGLMLAGLASITLLAIETYTTPLRCTAIGMFVCSGHMGAMIGGLVSFLKIYKYFQLIQLFILF